MKAAFIHDQVEYRLEVATTKAEIETTLATPEAAKNGPFPHGECSFNFRPVSNEEIRQGDCLACTLVVKNHDSAPKAISDLRLDLACAEIKSVRERKEDAFAVVASAESLQPLELGPQEQRSVLWTCRLDRNCPISDKARTLYLLYGRASGLLGRQPLTVQTHAHAEAVLRILETSFQFVLKGQKFSKGWVEAKLKPPSARRFSMLNELVLGFRSEGGELLLRFNFNVKKFETGAGVANVGRKKTTVERRLAESSYVGPGGYLNQERIEAEIKQALDVVAINV